MSRLLKSVLMSLLLAPSLTAAQVRSSLVKGQQVRVVSRCEMARDSAARCPAPGIPWPYKRAYSGQLDALDADTLRIRVRSNEAAFAIPTASIVRVSIVDGRRGHFWAGAGIGLLGGALIGGAIGSGQNLSGSFLFSETNPTVLGVVLGAPAGFLLGGVLGAVIRSDRWRAVPIKDHRISVAPRLDAVGFTVALTF